MRLQMFAIKTADLNMVLSNFLIQEGRRAETGCGASRPQIAHGLLYCRYYMKAVTHLNLMLWLGMRVIICVVKI
jgi:hypothetical protein